MNNQNEIENREALWLLAVTTLVVIVAAALWMAGYYPAVLILDAMLVAIVAMACRVGTR